MGLDMYAYTAAKAGQYSEFYESAEYDAELKEYVNNTVSKPHEIAYWRKHPNLHGWMRKLWEQKGNSGHFNGDELELTWEDLEALEKDVLNNNLPGTRGFFFGDGADEFYIKDDLEFVQKAKAELFLGLRVFYNSSW